MSFSRAFAIAFMAGEFARSDDWRANVAALLVGAFLWYSMADPMPGAIKRGLEAFAREYRR